MLLVNSNYFNGALRFNSVCMVVNSLFFIHFIISCYFSRKENGKLLDYWHFIVLVFFIIPVVCMYPFNASIYNVMSVHDNYLKIEPYINCAYIITISGYLSLLAGGWAGRNRYLKKDNTFIAILDHIMVGAIDNKLAIRMVSFFLLICMVFFIAFQISIGKLGDPRAFFMKYEIYRPIYNALISMFKFGMIFLGLSIINKKTKLDVSIFIAMCILGAFLGTRSAILDAAVYVFVFWVMSREEKVKLWNVAFFALVMIFSVIILGKFRNSGGEKGNIFDFLLYGNAYSDTRDFAWILASWDYHYVLGKTYLSGFLSFIPAHFSEYRETWAISRYTNNFVGLNSSIHPGLRPGKFGEPFFNFGIIGVLGLGFFLGYWLRYANDCINKKYLNNSVNNVCQAYSKTLPFQILSYFCITAGFFELYTWVAMVFCMYLANKLYAKKEK